MVATLQLGLGDSINLNISISISRQGSGTPPTPIPPETFNTYYVSNLGDDSNDGLSEETPWKTPYFASQQAINPGDQILFHRDEAYRCAEGSAASKRSAKILCMSGGTAEHPIVYGGYGVGDNPTFVGTVEYTDWIQHSGACYKRNESDTDFGAPTGIDNTGGTYKYSVFDNSSRLAFAPNLASCISTAGTWFGSGGVVYVHCYDDRNPNEGGVGYCDAALSHIVNTNGRSYITFDGIWVARAKASGFYVGANGTKGITFNNCWSYSNGQRGFRLDYDGVDGLMDCNLITCTAFDNMAEGIWINGTNMLVQGCEVYNGKADFTKKLGNTADAGGILVGVYSNGVTVKDCYVHDCYFNGYLWMEWENGYEGEISRPKNCIFDSNHILININQATGGKLGVVLQGDNTNIVKNNLIEATSVHTGNVVTINNGASGVQLYHNTIIGNKAGWIVSIDGTGSAVLKNNIIRNLHATAGENIYVDTNMEVTFAGNCFSSKTAGTGFYAQKGATGQNWAQFEAYYTAPGINALPVFVTEGSDYHLQSGSPCRNVGINLGITPDYDGVARDATPDIGAFEYVA